MAEQNAELEMTGKLRFPTITLTLLVMACFGLYFSAGNPSYIIITVGITTIGLIIFGERYKFDYILEKSGIPGREAWFPVVAVLLSLYLGAVPQDTIWHVLRDKSDIIALILSFAIISDGIAQSGYFSFAAYKIVQKCRGNTTRLILYLFILTSALTFVTSNDIVVLVFTPIIIAVCMHARIRNMRLLLLSQFIAANTLSMGLLIGSPTNIILSNQLNIDFVSYFVLMFIPSILSCMLTFVVVDFINSRSKPECEGGFLNFKGRWTYHDHYSMPANVENAFFTDRMKYWLQLFTAAVALVAFVSNAEASLFYAAIPISIFSLIFFFYDVRKDYNGAWQPALKSTWNIIRFLPFSVFFFGMSYFIFAYELSQQHYVIETLLPFIYENILDDLTKASVSMVFLSGFLVNTMNDLPAAALVAELMQQMEIHHGGLEGYTRMVVLQALLIGLNIGCYVTPIGALAGLLWFNIIRREERAQRKEMQAGMRKRDKTGAQSIRMHSMPDRLDLVKYGTLNFIFVGLLSGVLLPWIAYIIDICISRPTTVIDSSTPSPTGLQGYLPLLGLIIFGFIVIRFRRVLAHNSVFLGHMREVFVILTRVRIWSVKNRTSYHTVMGLSILVAASVILYWSEIKFFTFYGASEDILPLFQSGKEFMAWLLKYISSGLSEDLQPRSTLGLALTGIMPALTIGIVVILSRLTTEDGMQRLSSMLAKGEITGYRIVIINHHSDFENFVSDMLSTKDAAVLLLCSPAQIDRAQSFCNSLAMDKEKSYRVHAAVKSSDVYHNFVEYKMDEANEIYLLSDMTIEGEYEKLRYLTKLDEATNDIRLSQIGAAESDSKESGTISQQFNYHKNVDSGLLSNLPRIVIESSSRRFDDLVRRSSSYVLLKDLIQVSFDDELAEFVFSDLDQSLYSLNRYYRFLTEVEDDKLFVDNETPNRQTHLVSYPLDEIGKDLLGTYFGSSELNIRDVDTCDLVQHSMIIRRELQNKIKQVNYIKSHKKQNIPPEDFLGVVVDIAGRCVHMGVPSAAMSMQAVSTDKIILQEKKTARKKSLTEPDISEDMRLFIFNLTPISKAFIRKVLEQFPNKGPDIFILCHGLMSAPEDIQKSKLITVVHESTIEDLLNKICPTNAKRKTMCHMRPGDRLYVFNEFDANANPELTSIDFLDRLDGRIRSIVYNSKNRKPRISHRDLYIAVEVQGNEGRFLFENFFVDKIIDSSRPRVTYLEMLSKIVYRTIGHGELLGHKHATDEDFLKAAEIARYCSRFVTDFAGDVVLKDLSGREIDIVGLSYQEAAKAIQSYSTPPKQMFARMKIVSFVETDDDGMAKKSFRLQRVPKEQSIEKDDILMCLPLI